MNILYTLTAYPPSIGGAQLHAHFLAQELALRHDVQIASQWDSNRTDWLVGSTLRAPRRARDYMIDGISVHRIGLSMLEKARLAPWVLVYYPLMRIALPQLSACLERHLQGFAARADVIHNVRIGREALSYSSLGVARKCDVPFVLTPLHHPRWTGWRYRMFLELYTRADLVLALTNAEKAVLTSLGVPDERITVTGIGPVLAENADSASFLCRHGIDGPMVLFLGQHYTYKGYRQVLEAATSVWKHVPETHFVFAGPPVGRSEECFKAIEDRRVHRLGKVSLQEKTDALAACALLCVPSMQESFGGVYTEAWNLSKPVIACDIPAVSEVVNDDINGYLVRQDRDEIADRIVYLLGNPQRAQAMGKAGRCKVEERYTWQRLGRLTEEAYARVVRSRASV